MCRKARGPPSEQTKAKRAATRRENSWAKARKSSGATPLNFGVEPPPVSALPIARGAAGATPVDGSDEATSGSGDPTVAAAPVQQASAPASAAASRPPCPPLRRSPRVAASAGELPIEDSDDSEGNDSDDEEEATGDESSDAATVGEPQRRLHQAIADRLALETNRGNKCTDNWLLRYLRANGWWVRGRCNACRHRRGACCLSGHL